MKEHAVSFIVPALNEGRAVKETVAEITAAAESLLESFEIVLVDDGSSDDTGSIMDSLAENHAHITALHNPINLGLGGAFRRGVEAARLEFVMMIPGDNAHPADGLAMIIKHAGEASVVLTYVSNPGARNLFRRIVSRTYTLAVNLLVGLSLPYYNGLTIYRRELVLQADLQTTSFAFQAELLAALLKDGNTFVSVPTVISERNEGKTKAFRLRNMTEVGKTILRLTWKHRFARRGPHRRFAEPPS